MPEATMRAYSDGMILSAVAVVAVASVAAAAYFFLLHRTMNNVSPTSRAVPGWTIWLGFIPVAGPVWSLLFAILLSISIRKDFIFARRPGHKNGALPFSVGMALAFPCAFIPFAWVIGAPVCLALWITYWVKIGGLAKQMPVAVVGAERH